MVAWGVPVYGPHQMNILVLTGGLEEDPFTAALTKALRTLDHRVTTLSPLYSSIDPSQLTPLLVMATGFTALAAWIVMYRMRSVIMDRRALALRQAREARGGAA